MWQNWVIIIGLPALSWAFYRIGVQDGIQQCLQFLNDQGIIELEAEEDA